MWEDGTYSFTPSASVTGRVDPSKCGSPACPHDPQVGEMSGPNEGGSDGGSTPHNENFQPPLEGVSPTGPGKKPGQPSFKCSDCPDVEYANKSSLARHQQGKHKTRFSCSQPDCRHTWQPSRTSEFRKHLQNKHKLEDDKIDDEIKRILAMPPRLSHPTVMHNSQLGHAEPDVTTTELEDSSGLEHLAATFAPTAFLSEEEFAVLVRHLEIHGRIRFPSVCPGKSTTADIPPNPGMPYIPALPSPVGHYTSQVSEDSSSSHWTDVTPALTDASSRWGELGK